LPRPIGVIQKPGLTEDILRRLGVNRPGQPFTLDGDVVPVILIDSGVSFVASPTPPYAVTDWFTAGVVVAPAINTILADTGPLPTGSYTVQGIINAGEQNTFTFEWRDAANAANLRGQVFQLSNAGTIDQNVMFSSRFLVENVNERFRIRLNAAGNVGVNYQGTVLARI